MEKSEIHDNHGEEASVNNVLLPDGLLQSIGRGLYNSRSRHTEGTEDIKPLSQVIQQPPQAILARDAIIRSRTPDYGPYGRPQVGLGRAPNSMVGNQSRYEPSLEQNRRERSASIDLATLFRQREEKKSRTTRPSLTDTAKVRWKQASLLEDRHFSVTFKETQPPPKKSLEDAIRPPQRTLEPYFLESRGSSTYSLGQAPSHSRLYGSALDKESVYIRPANDTVRRVSVAERLSIAIARPLSIAIPRPRQTSIRNTYESAKVRQQRLQRSKSFQFFFQYTIYFLLLAFVYFILVGRPLWGGTTWYIYVLFDNHLTFAGGSAIFGGLAFFYAFGPLLVFFEGPASIFEPISIAPDAVRRYSSASSSASTLPNREASDERQPVPGNTTTALLVPCYKSASLLPATLKHALKIFPATSIFILANGNSVVPLDNTEEVCTQFGVNHIWIPLGSKIVAQYVGAYVIRHSFPHVLLIDDDCLLPPNFPIVTERLRGNIHCLGYTLASIGAGRSRGTWCQQAQDLEYKLSGLQRLFAGKIGSATFPHGAIVLWNTGFLIRTFKKHPGFSVSEDWFFGHVARQLGSRITMCTSVFVETETPASVFFAASGGARGGFGEMTVFKQRFKRWNFFFVNGCWYNLIYILFSWQLGFREVGTKLFVFQEVYETLLYLLTPLVLPISFFVRPAYTAYLLAGTLGLYFLNSLIFNEVHLRRSGKMVSRTMLIFYYMPFKLALTFVNVASCWWSIWQYARYFARRHPRIVEDPSAVGVVLKIEEAGSEGEPTKANVSLDPDEGNDEQGGVETPGDTGTGKPQRQQTETSTSSRRNLTQGPRRMTATAIKVDIVEDPATAPQRRTHASEANTGVDPLFLDTTDRASSTRSSTRRASRSVLEQMSSWRPQWTVNDVRVRERDAVLLQPVEEGEELEWECSRFEKVFVRSLS